MKNRSSHLHGAMLFALCLFLWGCIGGSSDPSSVNNVISGVASKGIIDGGSVRAYAIQDDGTKGVELGSALTDGKGNYNIGLGDYAGLVIVEVTGGTYTDEATGSIVDNNTLRAIIPPVNGNKKVAITPLTEMAVQIAGETLTLTKINNANAAVSVLMGGADIIETQPQDINGDLSGATDAEKNYTMILAAISQMIEDGSVTDVADAVAKISADIEDDGSLAIDGSGGLLTDALGNFVASAENNTGLTEADISLDELLNDAIVKLVLVKVEEEFDGDNVIDDITVYGYDANGRRIMAASDGDWGDDIVPDGMVDAREFTTYDADGKAIKLERDINGDGVIDSSTTNTYDANGDMSMQEVDNNNDGAVDQRITWARTNIAEGTRVVKDWDNNLDGVADQRITYTYDANGNMVLDARDDNADGTANIHFIYEYDADGHKIVEDRDYDVDGVNNHYTWTYDENGYLVMFESDGSWQTSPDGVVDARYIWTNDANGNRLLQESDTDGDGVIDTEQTWEYNAAGQVIRWDYDYNLDGVSEEYLNYTYDDFGNLILEEGNETLIKKRVYTWKALTAAPVLFSGSDGVNGPELWTTDGTEAGTNMIKDIDQSAWGSYPEGYAVVGNKVFFWAYESTTGYELWSSDGTALGTYLVKDLWPGSGSSNPHYFTAFNGKLYFKAIDYDTSRYALHVTDGTEAGTKLFLDKDGNMITSPTGFVTLGDKLILSASLSDTNYELFVTDGTEAGTYMFKDINPGASSSYAGWFRVIDDKVYFEANDGTNGMELWVTDATDAGTFMVKDIYLGYTSGPNFMTDIGGGKFVFRAETADAGSTKDEVWVSDGTEAGTVMILDPAIDAIHDLSFASIGSKAVFTSNNVASGYELWITDGTVAGTNMLKDIFPGADSSIPRYFLPDGGKVYFVANDGINGDELWITDGTEAGTKMLKDINPGAGSSSPWDLRVENNKLYFAANDGTHGNELWVTDGTEAGTHMIKDANPSGDGYIGVDEEY